LYFSASATPFSSGVVNDPRNATTLLCDAVMVLANADCVQSVALISVNESDSVRDLQATAEMPFNVPVQSAEGTLIANNFQTLLDAPKQMSLNDWGVSETGSPNTIPDFFWSGSQSGGEPGTQDNGALGDNCDDWTVSDATTSAKVGQPATGSGAFWLTNNDGNCNTALPLLCACWE
jgi:hypothetical protein